ncbi:TPA: hypothetical protein EYP12_07025 [Candidatus Bipolaricaulota bacterium]|nr:hypothetical protein [Candidatus Bipolaricaulota bacterium]
MRIVRIFSSWLAILVCIVGVMIGEAPTEVEVTCPQPQGCFMAIGEAIEASPEGAIIKIGPGTYYEKPLIIEKSLILVGAGRTQPVIGPFRTVIQAVGPGAAITIRYPKGRQDPISVNIKDLAISAWLNEDSSNIGIELVGNPGIKREDLQLFIEECWIKGFNGIRMRGPAKVTIQRCWIWVESQAIMGGEIEFTLLDSDITGGGLSPRIVLTDAEALLQGNRISGPYGAKPEGWGVMAYGKARLTLLGNTIERNAFGVYLAMDVIAEFRENKIVNNEKYGIVLALAPCIEGLDRELLFRGQILGIDNEIHDNGQDLCPEDYPWPEGFVRGEG